MRSKLTSGYFSFYVDNILIKTYSTKFFSKIPTKSPSFCMCMLVEEHSRYNRNIIFKSEFDYLLERAITRRFTVEYTILLYSMSNNTFSGYSCRLLKVDPLQRPFLSLLIKYITML